MKEKQCNKCLEIKSIKEFSKNNNYDNGYEYNCKKCQSIRGKQRRKKNKENKNRLIMKEKQCNKCLEIKSIKEFSKNNNYNDGFNIYCKTCRKKEYDKRILKPKPIITEKQCRKCLKIKPIRYFTHKIDAKDGYKSYCIQCNKNLRNTLDKRISISLSKAKGRAKDKKIEFDITNKFIHDLYQKQHGCCNLSGLTMNYSQGHEKYQRNPYILSIDRIDSTQGYTQNNVQLICSKLNIMKGEMDELEFLDIIRHTYQFKLKDN